MHILFIDTVYPLLKEELEKHHNICDTAYEKSKLEIEKIISDDDGIIIRSRFTIDKQFINKAKRLTFIARAGSGLENIDVEFNDEDMNISFNSRYLIDITSQIENDLIAINFKDAGSPALIKDLSDKNSFHVVMPMKI